MDESVKEVIECSVSSSSKTKKRKNYGRVADANKKLRAMSHELGESCGCTRLKCFVNITLDERKFLLKEFNLLGDNNKQSSYLSGLVEVKSVARHRPRKKSCDGVEAKCNNYSYKYKVRLVREGKLVEIPVCFKALQSIFGISNQKMITIKKSLTSTGLPPVDKRGLHKNRVHKKPEPTVKCVHEHIQSLRGRKSHYSLKKTSKIYLPEELNIKKLHQMYLMKYHNQPVSYEYYRYIFNSEYNIGFGYPRKDTCSFCDKMNVNMEALKKNEAKGKIDTEIKSLEIEKALHLRKADAFYNKKRCAKSEAVKSSKRNGNFGAVCMDYMKNLPCPNITTNDIYYKRQLSTFMFNIHDLSNGDATFYLYDQTIAKKGADDVCSMLAHYLGNFLNKRITKLTIFADSCAGQNKNYTLFRYLHYLCSVKKQFEEVKMVFPVRGHSFMETDKDMGNINQKAHIETPAQWADHIAESRNKPAPFKVFVCDQVIFKSWTDYLTPKYKKKCPFKTRPIKEIKFSSSNEDILLRSTYNGLWESFLIKVDKEDVQLRRVLKQLYNTLIPLAKAKYSDLAEIKQYCTHKSQKYFSELPCGN